MWPAADQAAGHIFWRTKNFKAHDDSNFACLAGTRPESPKMNKPYCQDDKRDPHRQQPLTGHLESMSEDHRDLDLASRRAIDVAIGILMGLRGCQKNEAVDEFLSAVGESGVGSTELGQALADLVSGEETSMHRAEALRRWSRLVALRERPVRRVPYGRYNKSTMC